MSDYTDKLKSLGFSTKRGTSRKKLVTNEDDGTRAGYQVEHWDDHVDAVAQPATVKLKVTANEEG